MIDFDKFTRLSKPGPRYTSYPTAVEFTENFGYDDFIRHLEGSNQSGKKLSLYVHLPFCRSACYFCGCNVVFTSKDEKKSRYIDYLEKELLLLSKHLDTSREVMQLHFGGGTPTYFSAPELQRIISLIKSVFPNFSADAELSCEIDPRFFEEEQMRVLQHGGFNRISFGVQDFDEQVQQTVHRIQGFDISRRAVELARKYGAKSVNIDLIYGLPHQTLGTFSKTLELAVSLNPDRFAVFNYAHVPWLKKTMRKLDETTLPPPAEKLSIMRHTIDYLTANGYQMIGMDHFAKPSDELFLAIEKGELHRNFQGYTTHGGTDLVGIGLTSISEFEGCYAQNFKEMESYESAIDAGKLPHHRGVELSDEDKLRKAVIMELMSNFKLDIRGVEKRFGIDFATHFASSIAALQPLQSEDLVSITPDFIEASPTGTLLIRNIAMVFDAYLGDEASLKNRFSKTV